MFLGLIALIIAAASVSVARGTQQSTILQTKQTQLALSTAKQALIAYATGPALLYSCTTTNPAICVRPGELPCPDINNDGIADTPCSTTASRLGRLPWKTLGLPDLRDGSGERLWYALSAPFTNNPRSVCTTPGSAGCLNSSTPGTITFKDSHDIIINDGTVASTAAIAVIVAPGSPLQRLDAVVQDRSCTGDASVANCRATGICSSVSTPLCKAINYLDITSSGEDNAVFSESSNTGGFVTASIASSSGTGQFNDMAIAISYADVMPLLQRRVAQEAMKCLKTYASANYGRYPWAATYVQAGPSSYFATFADTLQYNFGHFPDTLDQTQWSGGTIGLVSPQMANRWPAATCSIGISGNAAWWMNWKDLVYYAVAPAYAPNSTTLACTGTNCLTVDPASGGNFAKVSVFVGGPVVASESRSTYIQWNTPSDYLEGESATTSDSYVTWINSNPFPPPPPPWTFVFQSGSSSSTFNDTVIFQ
jgi:type II secretory pathway pseudopilin PulG